MRFDVLMAASTRIAVFCVVAPRSHHADGKSNKHLQNVGKLLQDYTGLQPRRQPS
jgi:hypothetical protein